MSQKHYVCPTCGYDKLQYPAWDSATGTPSFDICPCCGCEFGYNDVTERSKRQYLCVWLKKGAQWFCPELKPSNWDVHAQLRQIGIDATIFCKNVNQAERYP